MARNGTEVVVLTIPDCDIHKYEFGMASVAAKFDARTNDGRWAYVCQKCFDERTPGQLGTGRGQRLVLK